MAKIIGNWIGNWVRSDDTGEMQIHFFETSQIKALCGAFPPYGTRQVLKDHSDDSSNNCAACRDIILTRTRPVDIKINVNVDMAKMTEIKEQLARTVQTFAAARLEQDKANRILEKPLEIPAEMMEVATDILKEVEVEELEVPKVVADVPSEELIPVVELPPVKKKVTRRRKPVK